MPYIIALLVIAVLGVGFTLYKSNETDTTVTPVVTTTEIPVATRETLTYKDGTYTTKTTYQTPKRDEYLMDVSLTLAGDIVTDVTIAYSQGAEKDPNAQKFEAAYKAEVIGKDIDSLNLSRVGGASLTTTAFNNALTAIKTDAKS